jgi:hypothetical protein
VQPRLQVCYVPLQTENMLDMMTLTTGLTNQRLQKSQQWPGIFMSQ